MSKTEEQPQDHDEHDDTPSSTRGLQVIASTITIGGQFIKKKTVGLLMPGFC